MAQPTPPTRHNRTRQWTQYIGAGLAGAVITALVLIVVGQHFGLVNGQRVTDAYKKFSQQLADALDANCTAAGRKCVTNSKQVVKSLPKAVQSAVAPVEVASGRAGHDGAPGRGIVTTAIENSRLLVTYTDGTTTDVGEVVGHDGKSGKDGHDGKPGRGITTSVVSNGDLVVSYTDGTTKNLGPVVGHDGANGRGIATTAIVAGHLIITYTDNTAEDVGQVAGTDGASVSNPTVNDAGDLILTITKPQPDGSVVTQTIDAGHVVGKDGRDGADGKDAPTIVGHNISEDNGECVDTLELSDGSSYASNPYPCVATAAPSSSPSNVASGSPTPTLTP